MLASSYRMDTDRHHELTEYKSSLALSKRYKCTAERTAAAAATIAPTTTAASFWSSRLALYGIWI